MLRVEKEHRARPEHRAAPACFAASSGTRPHVVWFVWRGSAPHPATRRPTPRRNLTQSPQSPQRNTGNQPSRTSRTWREENDPRKSRSAPEQGNPKPILFSCGERTDLDAERSSRSLCSPPPLCLQTPAPVRHVEEDGRNRRCAAMTFRLRSGLWSARLAPRFPSPLAPVAQLDRASASGAEGCGFEPRQAHHPFLQTRRFAALSAAGRFSLPSQ